MEWIRSIFREASPQDPYRVSCLYRDSLTPVTTCLLAGFIVMTISYSLRLPPGQRLAPSVTAGAFAVVMGAMRLWLLRHTLAPALALPISMVYVAMVLVSLSVTLAVTRSDAESLHYGLLIIGSGLLFLSWPCLIVATTMTLLAWFMTVWLAKVPMAWHLYPHTLAGCIILAVMAMTIRRAAMTKLIDAMNAERLRQEDSVQLAQRLSSSEREYRDLFNQMHSGFVMQELIFDGTGRPCDARFITVNDHYVEMTGRSRESVVGRRVSEVVDEPDPTWIDRVTRVVTTGKADHFELESRRTHRTFDIVAYAVDARRFVLLMNDITQRRQQELALRDSEAHFRAAAESNRRLLSEVNHRVRNNLASLAGLLTLVRRQAGDVAQYHAAIEQRIAAMTHVHNLLADANWGDVGLAELITKLIASMQRSAPRQIPIHVDGPMVLIIPRKIAPLTMTLAELFNNSCKHGAHRSETGSIDISWTTEASDNRMLVDLRWRERGGPQILATPGRSLGLELIEGFVAFELGGTAHLRFDPQGVDHLIEFPITLDTSPTPRLAVAGDTMMSG